MSNKSSSILGRLGNKFSNSDTLFFNSQLSAKAIHEACHALGHSFRADIFTSDNDVDVYWASAFA